MLSGLQELMGRLVAPKPAAGMAMAGKPRRANIGLELLYYGIVLVSSAALSKFIIDQLDPFGQRKARQKALLRKKELHRRLGRWVDTEGYEDMVAGDMVISPAQVDVTLNDVGGLQDVIGKLRNSVLLPLSKPELFKGTFLRPARGLLLYGPPGTGKTMLAKALAKESGACFMNVRASHIQSKWFGDTQKLVSAIFSLAEKLAPCIIFIDEVDALLGRRKDAEHEAMTAMKTEFMQLWDGLLTSRAPIMVLAATNRPYELDDAVLRRFSLQLEVPLPDVKQRETILRLMVHRHWREGGCVDDALLFDEAEDGSNPQLRLVALATEGFSGSDLHGLFSEAAQIPVHEYVAAIEAAGEDATTPIMPRALRLTDLQAALKEFRPSNLSADMYRESTVGGGMGVNGEQGTGVVDFQALAALLRLAGMMGQPAASGAPVGVVHCSHPIIRKPCKASDARRSVVSGDLPRRAALISLGGIVFTSIAHSRAIALPLAPLGKVLSDTDKLDHPDIETVKDILAADLRDRQYFVTGQLTSAIFLDTCRFVDPTNNIVGLSRYIKALDVLFDPAKSRVELLDIQVTGPRTIEAEWTLGGELKFPWKPKVATFVGRCVYKIDEETGLIREQAQTWSKPAWEALQESFTPGW